MPSVEELTEALRVLEDSEDERERLVARLVRENPYRWLAHVLRGAGVDEEAVYGALLGKAQEIGDDELVVFEVLYGDGSVLGPSEAF